MEKYRKKVKYRIFICTALIIILLALSIYIFISSNENSGVQGFVDGFQMGLCTGIIAVCIVKLISSRNMLKDEKKLQLAYNKENDERMKAIRAKCGQPLCSFTSLLMIIAGIALARFDAVIFFTTVACGAGQLIICLMLKIIYSKIM